LLRNCYFRFRFVEVLIQCLHKFFQRYRLIAVNIKFLENYFGVSFRDVGHDLFNHFFEFIIVQLAIKVNIKLTKDLLRTLFVIFNHWNYSIKLLGAIILYITEIILGKQFFKLGHLHLFLVAGNNIEKLLYIIFLERLAKGVNSFSEFV